ncbi:MAG: AsmA family protein [Desulfobacterales bacterium]
MNKALKWILILAGGVAVIVIAVVVTAVMVLDADQLKSRIEREVERSTGRTFTVGQDLDLSFFPWIGVALSDVKLGNREGFSEAHFISMEAFEARVKLVPLFRKEIQVKRFVVRNPRIALEKTADGKVSWDFGGRPDEKPSDGVQKSPGGETTSLPLAGFEVDEFAITGGSVVYIDQKAGQRHEIDELDLVLTDLSVDRPVGIDLSASMDGHPVSMLGSVGPVGREIGKSPVLLDLTVKLLEDLQLRLSGRAENIPTAPIATLDLEVPSFSPRNVAGRFKEGLIPATADPEVLNRLSFKGKILAGTDRFELSGGEMMLDDSRIGLSVTAKDFKKPDLRADITIDALDVDRYLPPKDEKKQTEERPPTPTQGAAKSQPGSSAPVDYTPFRKPVLEIAGKVGKLIVNHATMENVDFKLTGRDGVFRFEPFRMGLYGGEVELNGTVDVRGAEPSSEAALNLAGVAAGPLIRDLTGKTAIEGTMAADVKVNTRGDAADEAKRHLNGTGSFVFTDGAIIGVDLAGMIRNVQAAFKGAAVSTERPKTDFTELAVPFQIKNGVVTTSDSRMQSPLLRLSARGDADLVGERLDFRIEPKVVASLKGQGDTEDRRGVMVPVLVTGTFDKPSFRPDLEGMARQQIQEKVLDSGKLDEIFEKNEELKPLEETTKGLIKGLLGPKKPQ